MSPPKVHTLQCLIFIAQFVFFKTLLLAGPFRCCACVVSSSLYACAAGVVLMGGEGAGAGGNGLAC